MNKNIINCMCVGIILVVAFMMFEHSIIRLFNGEDRLVLSLRNVVAVILFIFAIILSTYFKINKKNK